MRTAAALAALVAAASPLAARGAQVEGDGHKVTTVRELPPFDRVRLEGAIDVAVKVGGPQRVSVLLDGNLQQLLETRVEGHTLVVSSGRGLRWHGPGRVDVAVPALRGFAIEGSGDVTIEGGEGDLELAVDGSGDFAWSGRAAKLRAAIQGSGDVKLAGTAQALAAEVEGSGNVRARGLTAGSARIRVEGSGDVEVTLAGGTLDAEVSGSGDVRWWGDAKVERAEVSGSGGIARQ